MSKRSASGRSSKMSKRSSKRSASGRSARALSEEDSSEESEERYSPASSEEDKKSRAASAKPQSIAQSLVTLPPELRRLNTLDKINIKEKVKLIEVVSAWESTNEFDLVLPGTNELLFVATEHSGCCARNCCTWARGFDMKVRLNSGEQMFVARRTFKCCVCLNLFNCMCIDYCFGCCQDEMKVYGSNEEDFFGSVKEAGSCWRPSYKVFNSAGRAQFNIIGPYCMCNLGCCWFCPKCCRRLTFKVYDVKSGRHVGVIYKEFSGALKEFITDADNFGIEFPESIDVTMKAVLLSAVFLIDIIHFSTRKQPVKPA